MDGCYRVHDNGGRPFEVRIEENTAKVYRVSDNVDLEDDAIAFFVMLEAFIGQGNGEQDEVGNSILLQTGARTYVWIGWEIVSFQLHEGASEVTSFVSDIGPNDVPYPFAVTDDGYIYCFVEMVYFKHDTPDQFRFRDIYNMQDVDMFPLSVQVIHERCL